MAYTNTLTGLIPNLFAAARVVRREMVGFISAVSRDSRMDRAALDQEVRSPVAAAVTGEDIVPGQEPPITGGGSHSYRMIKINKSRSYPIAWTGEEELGLENAGIHNTLLTDRIAEAMRSAVNDIEVDCAAVVTANASRAYGTAGTTPFGTADDLSDVAEVMRILKDNGATRQGHQLVLGSAAMAKIGGKQSSLWKVNEAGTEEFLRQGLISQGLQGFALRESAQIPTHTKGTGAGYLSDLVAGYAVGDTTIHVDTGTGTILVGDVVTFAGDLNKYVVKTGFAGDGDGDIVLQEPGLRQTLANDVAMTIGGSYTANAAFHPSFIHLATRFPARPSNGDKATDVMPFTDPVTRISFELAVYPGYYATRLQLALNWGVASMNPYAGAILLG